MKYERGLFKPILSISHEENGEAHHESLNTMKTIMADQVIQDLMQRSRIHRVMLLKRLRGL